MRRSTYRKGKMEKWHYVLLLIILTSFVREGDGLRITQCVSNMAELDMDSSNNVITCEGAGPGETITWRYTYGDSNNGEFVCLPSGSCEDNSLFSATRGPQSTSSTVTPKVDIKQFRTLYGDITLTCSTGILVVSCRLDIVYRAEVTSCSAQFNTTVGTAWTASGTCVVSKAFSQRGRYDCLWNETTSGTSTEIQSSRTFTGSFDEGSVTYRSMTCDFRKSLPRVTGSYSYTAVISPGAVQPGVIFKGSSSIVLPTAHTNCPTDYVVVGDSVTCTCSSTNGNPAGSAVWRVPSGSSRLVLNDVRKDDHGDSYVCEVKWGSDVVSSATFRLQVTSLRITQCVSNMAELDMESSNNEITCEGAGSGETITWSYTYGDSNNGEFVCLPSGSCEDNSLFSATRGSQSTSSTVTPKVDIKQFRTIYGDITLTCSIVIPGVSCQLDVVYLAEVTSCSAQFNTAVGTAWTVSGSCVISKAFSQRGRYSCLWTETTSRSSTEIQSSRTFTGSFDEGGVTYISMTCDFRKSLPRVTGSYNYTAVISPGAVQPGVIFKGSSSIVLPTAHTDCPTDYVMEGDNVDCTCSSIDGNPAGSAVWRVQSNSSRLVLNDVRKDDHGDSYVCEVKWGSDVVSSATFRLQVAYPQAGESSSGGLSTGVAVGVALVFVGVVGVVVLMWRRHWVLPCASSSAIGSNNTEHNQAAVSPPVSVEREEQQNASSNEMPDDNEQATNQYEILQPLDIGVRSDYAELSHCHAGMKSDDGAADNQQATNQYEILRPLDVGVRSDYAELSHSHAGMKFDAGAGPPQGNTQPSDGRVYQNVAESVLT